MSKKDPQFMNVGHIAQTNRENNHYYFDEATVKYLQSKYYQHVFHYEEGSVTSVGPLGRFKTLEETLHNVEEIIKDDKKNRGVE